MDESILLFLQDNVRNAVLTPVMEGISMLGDFKGAIWIALALILIAVKKTRWVGISLGTALSLSGIITNLIIKHLVNRPRPYTMIEGLVPEGKIPSDASFPSGHTALGFVVATVFLLTLPWIMEKKRAMVISVIFIVLAVLVGFSRLYLGVHYPTDVLAGMLLGIVYGIVAKMVVGKIRERFLEKREAGE